MEERRHERGTVLVRTSTRCLQCLPEICDERERGVVLPGDRREQRYELWRTDGTSAGPSWCGHLPRPSGASPRYLTNVNGTLYFQASDGSSGYELWKSDGTSTGTVLVRDILLALAMLTRVI